MINLLLDKAKGQSVMVEAEPIWDEAHLKALLQLAHSPLHLVQTPPWDRWIQEHGGRKAVYAYLLKLEALSEDQRHLLQVILDHPRQTADFYAACRHISRKTYFRSLRQLLPVLEHSLNRWEPSAQLPLPLGSTFNRPTQVVSLIGREKEVAETARLLSRAPLALRENSALIFLDRLLQGTSGWEVLQTLRTAPATCHILVIIGTVLNEADQALEVGMVIE